MPPAIDYTHRTLDDEALSDLRQLQELHVADNCLRVLGLCNAQLPVLRLLSLAGNRLADMSELNGLALLPGLQEVTLSGCPLTRQQRVRLDDDDKEEEEERQGTKHRLLCMQTLLADTMTVHLHIVHYKQHMGCMVHCMGYPLKCHTYT